MTSTMGEKSSLFVSNGNPMQFHIKSCEDKDEIKQLIELFGGVISNKKQDGVIQLVTPTKGVEYDNAISFKYIYSCVTENQLLPVDRFMVNGDNITSNSESEDTDDDDDDDEEDEEEEDMNMDKESQINTSFSRADDEAVVNFINKNKMHKFILNNETYKLMKKEPPLSKFSTGALKKRFFDSIFPKITEFDVSEENIKNFLNFDQSDSEASSEATSKSPTTKLPVKSLNIKKEPESEEQATNSVTESPNEELILPDVDPNLSASKKSTSQGDSYGLISALGKKTLNPAKSLIEGMRQSLLYKTNQLKNLGESSLNITKTPTISYYDCVEIINYISYNNCFQDLKSDHTWKNMEKHDKLNLFSAKMLRDKFENGILPKILEFVSDVNPKRLKPFLLYAGKELIFPLDMVQESLCQVLNECNDVNCKFSHDKIGRSKEFSNAEDLAILDFIVKKNCFSDLKSTEVWKEMAKQSELKTHSVSNLRYRFKTLITTLKQKDSKINTLMTKDKCKLFSHHYDHIIQDLRILEDAEMEKEFTRAEDYTILGFIMEKRCVKDLDSNEVWQEMQKYGELKHHSAASLRKRFEQVLLPKVEQYSHCLPRKFMNSFLEYRFSKTNSKKLKSGDSESFVKFCLPKGSPEVNYPNKTLTGRMIATKSRRTRPTSNPVTVRSESLKILNLKKSLGAKLTSSANESSSSGSVDNFDKQLLKNIVPGIKSMQDKLKKAATSEDKVSKSQNVSSSGDKTAQSSEASTKNSHTVKSKKRTLSHSPEKSKAKVPKKNTAAVNFPPRTTRKSSRQANNSSGTQNLNDASSNQSFISALKGKLGKSINKAPPQKEPSPSKSISENELIDLSSASTSLRQKTNKTNTKENLTDPPKRIKGKLTEALENQASQSLDNNAMMSTNSHIEMLKKAKKGVFDVEEQISKWCCGSSGNLVHLRVDDLKEIIKNLKNVEITLYKAVLAARVELIMKSPLLAITEADQYELHKYLQLCKTKK